jgi:NAD(P)-dependent dehydrogenase (short-subunit alcohol dehydrogenase family)
LRRCEEHNAKNGQVFCISDHANRYLLPEKRENLWDFVLRGLGVSSSNEVKMRSLVFGSSGGIGGALVQHLSQHGQVRGISRAEDALDVTDEASVIRSLEGLEGQFDCIFIATGSLGVDGARPEKSIKALTPQALMSQVMVNAVGPAIVLKHAIRFLPKDRPAWVGVLSARVGSIGDNALGGWYSYRASKAALNQLIHSASIELARSHPHLAVACLHPGTVDTAFTTGYTGHEKFTPQTAAAQLCAVLLAMTPEGSGSFVDYQGQQIPW